MNELKRYRVTGVSKSTGDDVQFEVDAITEANARVKAELRDLIVTAVEPLPVNVSDTTAIGVDLSAQPSLDRSPELSEPESPVVVSSPDRRPVKVRNRILSVGWIFGCLAGLWVMTPWITYPHQQVGEAYPTAAGTVGAILGLNMFAIVSLILGIVGYIASGRAAGSRLIAFAVIVIAIGTAGLLRESDNAAYGTTSAGASAQEATVASDLAQIVKGISSSEQTVVDEQSRVKADKDVHGEYYDLILATESMVSGMLRDGARYQEGVAQLGLGSLLSPSQLDTAFKIDDARLRLGKAKDLLTAYSNSVRTRVNDARRALADGVATSAEKSQILAGFDSGVIGSLPQLDKLLAYEKAMYEELDVILVFMRGQLGRWDVVSGKIVFKSSADAVIYNASILRYQAIAGKQQVLGEECMKVMEENVELLNAAVRSRKFSLPPSPARPLPASSMRFEFAASGAAYNGIPLRFPLTIQRLAELWGRPSRVVEGENFIHVWDDLGLYAYSKSKAGEISSFSILLNRTKSYAFTPLAVYPGVVEIASVPLVDIDTPRSMNRRLDGETFQCYDVWGLGWALRFSSYRVSMWIEENGLSDSISVKGEQPGSNE